MGDAEDWLNRVGLTLQLLALFLVTPDIAGEDRMTHIRDSALKPINAIAKRLPKVPEFTVERVDAITKTLSTIIGVAGAVLGAAFTYFKGYESKAIIIVASLALGIGALFIFALLGVWIAKVSKSLLGFGAVIFTLGFVCLIAATFHPGEKTETLPAHGQHRVTESLSGTTSAP